MNVEEELINKIMMRIQKYVSDENLENVKDEVVCCVYSYEVSQKQTYEVIEYDDYNGKIMNLYLGSLAIEGKSPKTIQRCELVLRMSTTNSIRGISDSCCNAECSCIISVIENNAV